MQNNINKIIAGFAQSDPKYGLTRKKNFLSVVKNLKNIGINKIDTAPIYINSQKYISNLDDLSSFKITTKLPTFNYKYESIEKEIKKKIHQILKNNKISRIETLLIHDPLLPLEKKKWKKIFKCLNQLKKENVIKKIGISVYTVKETKDILNIFKPDVIQFPLNIFNQEFIQGDFLQQLKNKKITLIARSIFLQGLLTNQKLPKKLSIIFKKQIYENF